jgi:hypothetical protein
MSERAYGGVWPGMKRLHEVFDDEACAAHQAQDFLPAM